ncbi:MAG: DUF4143 domain-containing protein [Collinsella sp.]
MATRARSTATSMSTREPAVCPAPTLIHCRAALSISLNVFKTLIVRDIVQRHNVRNESALLRIADYMMDNVSNITSARNITDILNADGLKITNKTVGTYMGCLCDAFAFYKVRRYDIRGKKYLKSGEKYYLADHAFKYALLGTRDMDWGRIENMVAIELLRPDTRYTSACSIKGNRLCSNQAKREALHSGERRHQLG